MMRALLLVLLLGACAGGDAPEPVQPLGWRQIATEHDRTRLRGWRTAWMEALRKARAGGFGAQVDAEGALLHPDANRGEGAQVLPGGTYGCRVIKLGGDLLPFVSYPSFRCRVTTDGRGGVRRFVKETGSQRPVGTLHTAQPGREVFLGTLQLGDERAVMPYGRDRRRDLAAWVERIGPARWRMVFPRPAFESTLDIIELSPA